MPSPRALRTDQSALSDGALQVPLFTRRPLVALRLRFLLLLHFSLLALLHSLGLLIVFAIQLLQLLLLTALELLLPLWICAVLLKFLLLLRMLLLHLLALRALLLVQFFRFSLVFLLRSGVYARGVRGPCGGRTVFERATAVLRAPTVLRGFHRTSCFLPVLGCSVRRGGPAGLYRPVSPEFAGPRSCRHVWPAVVHRSQQSSVGAGSLLMSGLFRSHRDMVLASSRHFPRSRTSGCSARAAVETNPVDRSVVVDDRGVVGVVYHGDVYVGYGAVVIVSAAPPVAAEEADARVAEAVVNATIEAHFRSPVARVPDVEAFIPTPIPWSPEQTNFRRFYPCARNPEVTVRTISPIARDPDEAGRRANRLYIYGQNRWTDPNGNAHSNFRSGWSRYRQ